MADGVTFRIQGLRELSDRLHALPEALGGPVLERSVRAGAELIRADAAARAPRATGKLARSIALWTLDVSRDHVSVAVGLRRLPYAHLVEFGHRMVIGGRLGARRAIRRGPRAGQVTGGGREVGFVAARPFLRPAFDELGPTALERIGAVLAQELDRAVLATGVGGAG